MYAIRSYYALESCSLQEGAVVTTYANRTSMNWDELYDEMTEYALTINLA